MGHFGKHVREVIKHIISLGSVRLMYPNSFPSAGLTPPPWPLSELLPRVVVAPLPGERADGVSRNLGVHQADGTP